MIWGFLCISVGLSLLSVLGLIPHHPSTNGAILSCMVEVGIKISHLSKYYGRAKTPAVDDISLQIKTGEVYGFLGANGAGKSTTIRTVMDFIRPSSGQIEILGQNANRHGASLRRQVGYLPGDVVLPKRVTGHQLLHYLGQLSGGVDFTYLDQLSQRFEAQLDKRTDQLSKGNRQKIGLIQAFMHQPKVLILDEPTSGLDPLMQEQFYKTVAEARQGGAAIFLSSHSFDEVERICNQIGIIRQGKLVYEGSIAQMMADRRPRWKITLDKATDVAKLKTNSALNVSHIQDRSLTVEPTDTIQSALAVLAKVPIASFTMQQRELEDEFMSFYQSDPETQP